MGNSDSDGEPVNSDFPSDADWLSTLPLPPGLIVELITLNKTSLGGRCTSDRHAGCKSGIPTRKLQQRGPIFLMQPEVQKRTLAGAGRAAPRSPPATSHAGSVTSCRFSLGSRWLPQVHRGHRRRGAGGLRREVLSFTRKQKQRTRPLQTSG